MDTINRLIEEYKTEETSTLDKIDSSKKPGLVLALEDYIEDKRVRDFFFSVALNEQEYDLARIEVLKILEVKDFSNPEVCEKAADVIRSVLSKSEDEGVRNYA